MVLQSELTTNVAGSSELNSLNSLANSHELFNSKQPSHETCTTPIEHTPIEHRGWGSLNHRSKVNDSARLFTNPLVQLDMELDSGVPLYKSFIGSAEIQIVARGLFAAAFFALASRQLEEWHMGSAKQTWFTQPLEWVANGVDAVIGTPATKVISAFAGAEKAEHIMTFNKYVANNHAIKEALHTGETILNKDAFGMSLGQAVVDVTWAFAAGSTGAAIGRNMVLLADPNYKTSWWHNGKIDVGDMVKSTAHETFRILTYNEGEDWAVAIPYLIQRRLLNGALNKSGIGNMWDLQNGTGNAHILNNDGTLGNSYEAVGVAKLQHEFPAYNVGTLIYRDLYNHIGHKIKDWREDGFQFEMKLPEDPLKDARQMASEALNYTVKSFIKAQLYMQPSMLAFSFANIGINKANATLIDEGTKEFITTSPTYSYNPENMVQWNSNFVNAAGETPAHAGIAARMNKLENGEAYFAGKNPVNLDALVGTDMYSHHSSALSPIINPVGRATNAYANGLYTHITQPLSNHFGFDQNYDALRKMSDNFARAQTAYLPYMFTKYTLAQQVDTPEMDAAITRGLDGAASGKVSELWAGAKDVLNVIMGAPVSQITQAKTFEPRGLMNSTCDAKKNTELSQQTLKLQEAQERGQAVSWSL